MTWSDALRLLFLADGTSVHTRRWVRFFAARGHATGLAGRPHPELQKIGVAQYPLSERVRMPGGRLLWNVVELRRVLRNFQPSLLHAHYINEHGWIAAMSGFRPFVLTAWGSDVYLAPQRSRLVKIVSSWAVRAADFVTADSADQISRLRDMGADPNGLELVGWGVDVDKFSPDACGSWRSRLGISAESVVILSPRHWRASSNIETVLLGFAEVVRASTAPPPILVLKHAGETTDESARILGHLRSLAIDEHVRIVGDVEEDDLPGLYATADVTVSIGRSDGTPVSVLEAMASGSVVVAGDLPSLREWISHDENGILVSTESPSGLANELRALTAAVDRRRRLAARARQTVIERADRRRYLNRMEEIYEGLIARSASRRSC